jgi:hypothetical protein
MGLEFWSFFSYLPEPILPRSAFVLNQLDALGQATLGYRLPPTGDRSVIVQPDVSQTQGSQHGIHNGVGENIGIAVP